MRVGQLVGLQFALKENINWILDYESNDLAMNDPENFSFAYFQNVVKSA